jgi:very-short-patch-repair endonuclease
MESHDAAVRHLAANQHGVVARRQLLGRGVNGLWIEHRLERGYLRTLSAQVLELVGSPNSDGKWAMAAVLDAPQPAVLSHQSAAAWWGLPGFDFHSGVHVTVPRKGLYQRTRLARIHYNAAFPMDQIMNLRGIPVSSPALTIFQLAGVVSRHRTERALDNAWAIRLLSGEVMQNLLRRLAARGRNGIATMRVLIRDRPPSYVPPASGVEARYMKLLEEHGIPQPRRQVEVVGEFWLGRVDFEFEDLPLVVEILSERYHASLLDRAADERRFTRLRASGREVLTIWDYEVWNHPFDVIEKTLAIRGRLLYQQLLARDF